MLSKNAIGNLKNRYVAILKKCNLLNVFGSLALASLYITSGASFAFALSPSLQDLGGAGVKSYLLTIPLGDYNEDGNEDEKDKTDWNNYINSLAFDIKSAYTISTIDSTSLASDYFMTVNSRERQVDGAYKDVTYGIKFKGESYNPLTSASDVHKDLIGLIESYRLSNSPDDIIENSVPINGNAPDANAYTFSVKSIDDSSTNLYFAIKKPDNSVYSSSGNRKTSPEAHINESFIKNSSAQSGGAISNPSGNVVDSIQGDFIGNSSENSGGALFTIGTVQSLTSDFIGNSSKIYGGAIYAYGGKITRVISDFIANSAVGDSFAYGGAIALEYKLGHAALEKAKITLLEGAFLGNSAIATADSEQAIARGGAISNDSSYITAMVSDFIANRAISEKGVGYGGAIYGTNSAVFNSIAGDFIGNSVSAHGESLGGAIYTMGVISEMTGSFLANSAESNTNKALGGAIYTFEDLTFSANGTNHSISGNYTLNNAIKDYNAIYIDGENKAINFNLSQNASYTLNDNVKVSADNTYTFNIKGDGSDTNFYLNNALYNASEVNVDNATLNLGSHRHEDLHTANIGDAKLSLMNNSALNINVDTVFSNTINVLDGTVNIADDTHTILTKENSLGTVNNLGLLELKENTIIQANIKGDGKISANNKNISLSSANSHDLVIENDISNVQILEVKNNTTFSGLLADVQNLEITSGQKANITSAHGEIGQVSGAGLLDIDADTTIFSYTNSGSLDIANGTTTTIKAASTIGNVTNNGSIKALAKIDLIQDFSGNLIIGDDIASGNVTLASGKELNIGAGKSLTIYNGMLDLSYSSLKVDENASTFSTGSEGVLKAKLDDFGSISKDGSFTQHIHAQVNKKISNNGKLILLTDSFTEMSRAAHLSLKNNAEWNALTLGSGSVELQNSGGASIGLTGLYSLTYVDENDAFQALDKNIMAGDLSGSRIINASGIIENSDFAPNSQINSTISEKSTLNLSALFNNILLDKGSLTNEGHLNLGHVDIERAHFYGAMTTSANATTTVLSNVNFSGALANSGNVYFKKGANLQSTLHISGGTTTFGGESLINGATTLTAGTLLVDTANNKLVTQDLTLTDGKIQIDSGTLDVSAGTFISQANNNFLTIASGATFKANANDFGHISQSGVFDTNSSTVKGTIVNNGTLTLSGLAFDTMSKSANVILQNSQDWKNLISTSNNGTILFLNAAGKELALTGYYSLSGLIDGNHQENIMAGSMIKAHEATFHGIIKNIDDANISQSSILHGSNITLTGNNANNSLYNYDAGLNGLYNYGTLNLGAVDVENANFSGALTTNSGGITNVLSSIDFTDDILVNGGALNINAQGKTVTTENITINNNGAFNINSGTLDVSNAKLQVEVNANNFTTGINGALIVNANDFGIINKDGSLDVSYSNIKKKITNNGLLMLKGLNFDTMSKSANVTLQNSQAWQNLIDTTNSGSILFYNTAGKEIELSGHYSLSALVNGKYDEDLMAGTTKTGYNAIFNGIIQNTDDTSIVQSHIVSGSTIKLSGDNANNILYADNAGLGGLINDGMLTLGSEEVVKANFNGSITTNAQAITNMLSHIHFSKAVTNSGTMDFNKGATFQASFEMNNGIASFKDSSSFADKTIVNGGLFKVDAVEKVVSAKDITINNGGGLEISNGTLDVSMGILKVDANATTFTNNSNATLIANANNFGMINKDGSFTRNSNIAKQLSNFGTLKLTNIGFDTLSKSAHAILYDSKDWKDLVTSASTGNILLTNNAGEAIEFTGLYSLSGLVNGVYNENLMAGTTKSGYEASFSGIVENTDNVNIQESHIVSNSTISLMGNNEGNILYASNAGNLGLKNSGTLNLGHADLALTHFQSSLTTEIGAITNVYSNINIEKELINSGVTHFNEHANIYQGLTINNGSVSFNNGASIGADVHVNGGMFSLKGGSVDLSKTAFNVQDMAILESNMGTNLIVNNESISSNALGQITSAQATVSANAQVDNLLGYVTIKGFDVAMNYATSEYDALRRAAQMSFGDKSSIIFEGLMLDTSSATFADVILNKDNTLSKYAIQMGNVQNATIPSGVNISLAAILGANNAVLSLESGARLNLSGSMTDNNQTSLFDGTIIVANNAMAELGKGSVEKVLVESGGKSELSGTILKELDIQNGASVNIKKGSATTSESTTLAENAQLHVENGATLNTNSLHLKSNLTIGDSVHSEKGGALIVDGVTVMNGQMAYFDPAWMNGIGIEGASFGAFEKFNNNTIDGALVAGQNSFIVLGDSSTQWAQDSFKNSGLIWGENHITAALFINNSIALDGTYGSIIIDGVHTTAPTTISNNSAKFGNNSLLTINANNLSANTAALSSNNGTLELAANAQLIISGGENGQIVTVVEGFSANDNSMNTAWGISDTHAYLKTDSSLMEIATSSYDHSKGSYTVSLRKLNSQNPYLSTSANTLLSEVQTKYSSAFDHENKGIAYYNRILGTGYLGNESDKIKAKEVTSLHQFANLGASNAMAYTVADSVTSLISEHTSLDGIASNEITSLAMTDYREVLRTYEKRKEQRDVGVGVWFMPIAELSNVDERQSASFKSGYEATIFGGSLGVDYAFANYLTVGTALSMGAGGMESVGDLNKTENDFLFWGVGLYGAYEQDNFALVLDLNCNGLHNDMSQNTHALMAWGRNQAEVDSTVFGAGLKAQYRINTDLVNIIPHVGARYTYITTGTYDIKGNGGIVANIASDSQGVISVPLGVRLQKDFALVNNWRLAPQVDVGIVAAFGDLKSTSLATTKDLSFAESYTMENIYDYTLNGGLGFELAKDEFSIDFNYTFEASKVERAHGVKAHFRYEF